jgi:uncharacterized membrane protein
MLGTLENTFFYFIFYSVLGWVYETILCSLEAGRGVNRGFLNGPYLPIYGFGAISFLILLGKETNPLFIFIFGGLVACTIEYVTSVAMEKTFGARWWDYSKRKYNFQGRVCLGAGAMFGLFAVVLVKFLHPIAFAVFSKLPAMLFNAVNSAAVIVFILDLVITLKGMKGFPRKKVVAELTGQQKRLIKAFPTLKNDK